MQHFFFYNNTLNKKLSCFTTETKHITCMRNDAHESSKYNLIAENQFFINNTSKSLTDM